MSTNHATSRLRRVYPDAVTPANALLRWKNQDPTVSAAATALPQPSPTEPTQASPDEPADPSFTGNMGSMGDDILRLLRKGESVDQISALLRISKSLIKRWQHQLNSAEGEKLDGRRLYDDAFKQLAIQQIDQGVSVRQLAIRLGVSQVTLHKWKNQAVRERTYPNPTAPPTDNRAVASPEPDPSEPLSGPTTRLQQELQNLREERDILKKALVILLRSS
ncbi:hypothetical protein BH09BAC4_BH09BAC4_44780 [soil metagenome]